MKKKQFGRPKINEEQLLYEQQLKLFAQTPNIFKDLGFSSLEPNLLLAGLEYQEEDDNDAEADGTKKKKDGKEDIEDIIMDYLNERENISDDSEEEFDYDEVER